MFLSNRKSSGANWFGVHKHSSIVKAGLWSTLQVNTTSLIQIGTAIVMARLLLPEDFGVIAMVAVLYNLLSSLSSIALSSAAIQKKDLSEQQASNFFWICSLLSACFGIVVACAGPMMSRFFQQPELVWLALIYGLLLVLDGLAVAHRGILQRAMRFDVLFAASILSAPFSIGTAVGLALLGAGPYALAGQMVIGGILERLLLFTYLRWRPLNYSSGAGIRSMLSFGGRSALALIVHFIYQQGQVFVLGSAATIEAAGYYNRGQALFQRPFGQIMGPMLSVFLPLLSAKQDDPVAINRFILRAIWMLGIALMPMLLVVIHFGEAIVSLILGHRWAEAGIVMEWFAIGAFPWVLIAPLVKALEALGRPAKDILISIVSLPVFIVGSIWAASWGAPAIVMVYVALKWLGLPFSLWLTFRGEFLECRKILMNMLFVTLVAFVSSCFLAGLMYYFQMDQFLNENMSDLIIYTILGLIVLVSFALMSACFEEARATMREIISVIFRYANKKRSK